MIQSEIPNCKSFTEGVRWLGPLKRRNRPGKRGEVGSLTKRREQNKTDETTNEMLACSSCQFSILILHTFGPFTSRRVPHTTSLYHCLRRLLVCSVRFAVVCPFLVSLSSSNTRPMPKTPTACFLAMILRPQSRPVRGRLLGRSCSQQETERQRGNCGPSWQGMWSLQHRAYHRRTVRTVHHLGIAWCVHLLEWASYSHLGEGLSDMVCRLFTVRRDIPTGCSHSGETVYLLNLVPLQLCR